MFYRNWRNPSAEFHRKCWFGLIHDSPRSRVIVCRSLTTTWSARTRADTPTITVGVSRTLLVRIRAALPAAYRIRCLCSSLEEDAPAKTCLLKEGRFLNRPSFFARRDALLRVPILQVARLLQTGDAQKRHPSEQIVSERTSRLRRQKSARHSSARADRLRRWDKLGSPARTGIFRHCQLRW